MSDVLLSGTGLFTPATGITNEELVASFNSYVAEQNRTRSVEDALPESSPEFIVKASGIEHRYTLDREGILDPSRMRPKLSQRSDEELSVQAEMSFSAAREALEQANISGSDLDAVLVCCANFQRPYPAIAVELQEALGCQGFAFDMNVACSSSTFGVATATSLIKSGAANRVLVASPEICTAHLNFRDRDSHFIFGDAAVAVVVERRNDQVSEHSFEILSPRLSTKFSNNIRNNRGFLTACEDRPEDDPTLLFYQQGRKVFKEVTMLATAHMQEHLEAHQLTASELKSLWLHQANAQMNLLMARKLLGRDPTELEVPLILDRYANTSSAGSIIAFHLHREHLASGDYGMICSFGAGYSIGSLLLRKV